jgi:hypothetical protein
MAKNKIPVYDPTAYYELGTQVRRVAAGFNSQDVLGTVVGHDFFGAAAIEWQQQEVFL